MTWKSYRALVACPLFFGAALAMASGTPTASTEPSNSLLRVLVGVDGNGKVVKASPASAVQPAVEHMLLLTLSHAISRPAHDATGKPVPSSFVINLSLKTSPTAHGKYQIELAYKSIKPLPAGSWIWCHARKPYLVHAGTPCRANQRPMFQPALGWDLLSGNPRGAFTRAEPGKR